MTEKDLLDSLRFVDDDLIEEAGLEQLKEEKQKKINGKVIFLRTALTAAAGICIFTAGTVMGRKITAKKDQTDGALMMAEYKESEYEFEQNNVSYTLQADTLRKVVQAAADTICGMGIVTVVD